MGSPYSNDLRQRIVEAHANGEGSVRDRAERFVVAPKNDRTLDELVAEYARRHGGEAVARSTMSQAGRRLEWTKKKRRGGPASRTGPTWIRTSRWSFACG